MDDGEPQPDEPGAARTGGAGALTLVLAVLLAAAVGSLAFFTSSSSPPQAAPTDSVAATAPQRPTSSVPEQLAYAEENDTNGSTPGNSDSLSSDSENGDLDDPTGFNFDFGELDPQTTTLPPTTLPTVADADPAPPAKSTAPGSIGLAVPEQPVAPAGFDLRAPHGGSVSWSGIGDAADPFVLRTGAGYYAYTTNTSTGHVPAWFSTDLGSWQALGDVMPDLPAWAAPSATQTWAPAALTRGGTTVLYFTSRDAASNRQCIGVATADEPKGPFVAAPTSLVCQTSLGGSIDPSVFVDTDGQAYLLFKNDGNCCRLLTSIWSQPLSADGLQLIGSPRQLLWSSESWEGALIEGPSMTVVDGRYHLIYSANSWASNRYAMGHAVCESALGPCYKSSDRPWRASDGGPGGGEFFVDEGGSPWLAFHEWRYRIGYPGGVRSMYFEPLGFNGPPPAPVTTVPPTTVPSSTVPVTTIPVTTLPPTTVPPTTRPSTTAPPVTVPPTTAPPTTAPPTTAPPTTAPSTTVPPTTVPPTTVPQTTVPPTAVPSTTVSPTSGSESSASTGARSTSLAQ